MYAATPKSLETGRPGRGWGVEYPLGDRRNEKRDEELGGDEEGGNGRSVKKIKVIF